MDIHNVKRVSAFTTKDGSEIRELLAHRNSCIRNQSLAEAQLPAGSATMPHFHPKTEEIYYILEGRGEMILAQDKQGIIPGDAIAIPPGVPHQMINQGSEPLVFLCCCAPAYEDADTVMLTKEKIAEYSFHENSFES